MNSTSRIRVLGIRGRDINGEHLIAVEQTENGMFENRGKWMSFVQTESETQILDALVEMTSSTAPEWFKAKDIAGHIGKSVGAVQRAITRMLKAGRDRHKEWRVETKKGSGIKLTKT